MESRYPSDEEIRLRAYLLWERDGRPEGHGIDYWLQAARELEDGIDPPQTVVRAPSADRGADAKTAGSSGNGSETDAY